MVIAVAAFDRGLDSRVEERFGRAPFFVIHDTDTAKDEILENEANAAAAHGAGTGTAQQMISHNVDVVVAGRFGPKAEYALTAAGIRFVSWSGGTVRDALEFTQKEIGGRIKQD